MGLNKYDSFLKNKFMPSVTDVLRREDARLKNMLSRIENKTFYKDDNLGITSYTVTERMYQYIIYRSLAGDYRMTLEDLSYSEEVNKNSVDISIYKSKPKKDHKYADIGIEIKRASLSDDGVFTSTSRKNFKTDYVKIKKAKHENKYLFQIVAAKNLKKLITIH